MTDLLTAKLPISTVTCGDMVVEGHSVSAYSTFVMVRSLNVCFDIGSCIEEMIPLDHVFITHGHQDHVQGVTRYAALRVLQRMSKPTIYLPSVIADDVQELFTCWSRLENKGGWTAPLKPMQHGSREMLNPRLMVEAFDVDHTLPSLGYTIFDHRKKLKKEYFGTPGQKLAELKKQGVTITNTVTKPLVTYVGDCSKKTLSRLSEMEQCSLLIIECTFLDDEHRALAEPRGHLHIDDILECVDDLPYDRIVLTHFSRRYHSAGIHRKIASKLPDHLTERIQVLA